MGINARGKVSGVYPPLYRSVKARTARAKAKLEQQAVVLEAIRELEEKRRARVRQREEEKEKAKKKEQDGLAELVRREVEKARVEWEAEAKAKMEEEVLEGFRAGWFRGVDNGRKGGRRVTGMAAVVEFEEEWDKFAAGH